MGEFETGSGAPDITDIKELEIQPLTKAGFAAFGTVIETYQFFSSHAEKSRVCFVLSRSVWWYSGNRQDISKYPCDVPERHVRRQSEFRLK